MSTTDELRFVGTVIPVKSMMLWWGCVWLITSLQVSTKDGISALAGEFPRQQLAASNVPA